MGDTFERGSTRWTVLGLEADGRVFARSAHNNTAFITHTFESEDQQTPEDSAVCVCGNRGDGFTHDVETGLYVHAACRKPTALHLESMARRAGAWS